VCDCFVKNSDSIMAVHSEICRHFNILSWAPALRIRDTLRGRRPYGNTERYAPLKILKASDKRAGQSEPIGSEAFF
ncbi:hypothetical protein AVEN_157778-1, partial [Araneus ventricosus]